MYQFLIDYPLLFVDGVCSALESSNQQSVGAYDASRTGMTRPPYVGYNVRRSEAKRYTMGLDDPRRCSLASFAIMDIPRPLCDEYSLFEDRYVGGTTPTGCAS